MAPHGNSQISAGQCRCVVDAVADHSDSAIASDQFFDFLDLIIGEQLGMHLVDSNLACDRFRSDAVIPRQHGYVRDASRVQLPHNFLGLGSYGVGSGNESTDMLLIAQSDHGLASRL